jgi:hypothetical protein
VAPALATAPAPAPAEEEEDEAAELARLIAEDEAFHDEQRRKLIESLDFVDQAGDQVLTLLQGILLLSQVLSLPLFFWAHF